MTPTFSCGNVDGDEAVAAFAGGVGDVDEAGGAVGEVDAEVVEVGIGIGDFWGKDDGLEDGVVGEVYSEDFGAAWRSIDDDSVGEGDTSGVEDPGAIGSVDDDGLGTDEIVLVIGARGRVGGVVDSSPGWVIDLYTGPGDFVGAIDELTDGEAAISAIIGVGWVQSAGVIGEEATFA